MLLGILFPTTMTSNHDQGASFQEQADDTASQDSNSDTVARTPPSKSNGVNAATLTPAGNHASPVSLNVSVHNLSGPPAAISGIPASNPVRNALENTGAANSLSSVNQSSSIKEEEINSFPGLRASPSLTEAAHVRGISRNSLSNQVTSGLPLGSGNIVSSNGALGSVPSASEITKRNILGADDRLGSSGVVQPLLSPLSNRMMLPQAVKANDGTGSVDSSNVNEAAAVSGRVFSPSGVSGVQWRPGSPFQNQSETVIFFIAIIYLKFSLAT